MTPQIGGVKTPSKNYLKFGFFENCQKLNILEFLSNIYITITLKLTCRNIS